MVYTSNYRNCHGPECVSISGDHGLLVKYCGSCYTKLAPHKDFWQIWHDNIGVISDDANNEFYMQHYYNEVLSKLDPQMVFNDLNGKVLLCYESNEDFCHRHLVASWLELFLDNKVPEVIKGKDDKLFIVPRISGIKESFEKIIKENIDMKDFHSLRALYLFQIAENMQKSCLEKYQDGDLTFNDEMNQIDEYFKLAMEEEKLYLESHPTYKK